MSVNACFDFIVGFSRNEDQCIDGGQNGPWDSDYTLSDSGLYIDELPGFPQRFIASLGGSTDLWEKMTNARENAINAFKIDALEAISKFWEPSRSSFKGLIGDKSYTTTLLTACTYQGLRMYSDILGGEFILRGFWLFLNVSEWVTLSIYDDYQLLYAWNIQAVAGRPTYNAITPISLPLNGNYYFVYQTTGRPYNNHLTCNCGSFKWCFNIDRPCYKYSRDGWTEWAMVGGVCGSDINDRYNWSTSRDAYGLALFGNMACDIMGSLCSEHSDFQNNKLDAAIAYAIWYKTGEFLSAYLMDTEEVNRKVLLGVEQWNRNIAYYNDRYAKMINFIAQHYEEDRNECLQCKDPFGFDLQQQIL